ncbi:MAG: helix-hairpin-helix domain-containing protein, partial [Myxococcota bacterium]
EELVLDLTDFFQLETDDLIQLDRMGQKLADKLIAAIQERRTVPAALFLRSFGIDELGKHVSKILAERHDSMEELFKLTDADLSDIHTIGDVIAERVTKGLADRREDIEALMEFVTPVFPDGPEEAVEGPLSGRSFLFTGTLATMKRKDAQARVQLLGGDTPSSVSKDLNFLVIGDEDYERYEGGWRSSKLKKAEKYIGAGASTEIINESRFLELLDE